MTDKIERIGNSIIQHGKENNRIYLIKIAKEDCPGIVSYMDNLAINDGYTKIIGKIPTSLGSAFLNNGYAQEAFIRKFYKNGEDCHLLSKYFTKERGNLADKNDILIIVEFCMGKANLSKITDINEAFNVKLLDNSHIAQIVKLYKKVFETYPFPIFDGNYIKKTMKKNIDYFGVFEKEKLVAIASSEMDLENLNTEMTDFATLPEYRGKNLSYHLLKEMEKTAIEKNIKTAYTIARAKNTGINMTFAKMAYEFSGTLTNNTNICGSIETMNVWYKNL